MNIYRKIKTLLLCSVFVAVSRLDQLYATTQEPGQLDAMIDFAYPVSIIQSVRKDVSQALYYLQQSEGQSTVLMLQDALSKLMYRKVIEQDDADYIQEMINNFKVSIKTLYLNYCRPISRSVIFTTEILEVESFD